MHVKAEYWGFTTGCHKNQSWRTFPWPRYTEYTLIQEHKQRSSLFNLWYFIIDYVPAMTHHWYPKWLVIKRVIYDRVNYLQQISEETLQVFEIEHYLLTTYALSLSLSPKYTLTFKFNILKYPYLERENLLKNKHHY